MIYSLTLAILPSFCLAAVHAQQPGGREIPEVHPKITIQQCSVSGSCQTLEREIVLDANWRWLRDREPGSYNSCIGIYDIWDEELCPSPTDCAKNCELEGADYTDSYGITTSGDAVTLKFITQFPFSKNVGSRVFLMDSDSTYQTFDLNNQEFSFDVDTSDLTCGFNGALYFLKMDKDGGMRRHPGNKAGAKYGTGYCDSRCPRNLRFINGEANLIGWTPGKHLQSGWATGQYGSCCEEMALWEANANANAYTPRVCRGANQQTRCLGLDCGGEGDSIYQPFCDRNGCDFNAYRLGNPNYFGPGKTVNTDGKVTVVTQFLSPSGKLSEIRRFYVQNGRVISNSFSTFPELSQYDSISDKYCRSQKALFGERDAFSEHGGLTAMGKAFQGGMVLAMSLWDDPESDMLWMDAKLPVNSDPARPGVNRGPCAVSGYPEILEYDAQAAKAKVTFSNIKYGPIGSTHKLQG